MFVTYAILRVRSSADAFPALVYVVQTHTTTFCRVNATRSAWRYRSGDYNVDTVRTPATRVRRQFSFVSS